MGYEFTEEEIQEVVKVARIYCHDLTEEQLQTIIKMGGRVKEKGYLEAVESFTRLEKEGIPVTQALEKSKALVRRNTEVEHKINDSQSKLQDLETEKKNTEADLNQMKEAIGVAKKELQELRSAKDREEKELEQFRLDAQNEKASLQREVEQAHKRTNVTLRDIGMARGIKSEIKTQGLTLELVLNLAKEFGSHENAHEELAEVLNRHQKLRDYIASMEQQCEQRKNELQFELGAIQGKKEKTHTEITNLEASRRHLETVLAKLQENEAYENDMRRFHRRYWIASRLMEYLATWDQVLFLRCDNPISNFTGMLNSSVKNARFWTDQPAMKCPHCGLNFISYDEKPYQALNLPVGEPLRIVLGE